MNKTMNRIDHMLSLDTATGDTCACLLAGGRTYPALLAGDQRMRSTGIVPMLTDLLQQAGLAWSDLELLVFSHGPGSFTGLRIGAATLAGINSGLHLPVLHISALAVTARQAAIDDPLWVLEDARAGEVFVGCYQHGMPLLPDRCMQWQDVAAEFAPGNYVCHAVPPVELPGWQRKPLVISRAEALGLQVQAAEFAQDALSRLPRYPKPEYMQLSQAERSADAG